MSVLLNPYLSFRDNAREAMTFYQSVFGGELTVSTFADFDASADPTEQDKIMHAQLETPDGLVLMGADTPDGMEYRPQAGVSVSLSGDDEPRLRGYWERLSEGGSVTVPFEKAPWGDTFGMCVDRFGTSWQVNAAQSERTAVLRSGACGFLALFTQPLRRLILRNSYSASCMDRPAGAASRLAARRTADNSTSCGAA
jgi:PhnB protein